MKHMKQKQGCQGRANALLREVPPERLREFVRKQVERHNHHELQLKSLLSRFRIKYEYQKPMGNYIPDFYLPKYCIVLEVDGASHNGKEDYDRKRDKWFFNQGITTVRIRTEHLEVIEHLSRVQFLSRLNATARSRQFPIFHKDRILKKLKPPKGRKRKRRTKRQEGLELKQLRMKLSRLQNQYYGTDVRSRDPSLLAKIDSANKVLLALTKS